MLMLERKPGEGIVIRLSEDTDPETPIADVLAEPINIQVVEVCEQGREVRLGFTAEPAFDIALEEDVNDIYHPHGL